MTDRPRIVIPFGGGLDRESGLMVVDRGAFADLRNFHLRLGKLVLRNGLGNTGATFGDATDIVAIHPIRSRARGVVITYKFGGGASSLTLWDLDADGTLPVSSPIPVPYDGSRPPPRLILADSYGKLFIAHDEPDINDRMATQVFDLATGTWSGITGLDGSVAFRGVQRHLNYMTGWGYGTSTDPDRPETFRISKPGEPTVFDPNHYFLVGQPGEPVMMADPAGQILAVKKLSETYQLQGYDRSSFGMIPLDIAFGQIAPRLSVSVSGVNYFWSETGPRRTGGGPSEDLAMPLDLGGPAPDALATFDTDDAFAYYDHDNREVVFNFGQWQYVLSLWDSTPRWSYNQLGVKVGAAGVFYELEVSTAAAPPSLTTTLVAFISATQSTMTWSVTIAGVQDPTDSIEFWVKELVTGIWTIKKSELLAGRTAFTSTITGLFAGYPSDWAVRPVRAGVPGTAYPTGDPTSWPTAAKKIGDPLAFTTNPAPVFDSAFYFNLTVDELRITFDSYTGSHAGLEYVIEVSDGVGGWTAVTEQDQEIETVTAQVTAFAGLTRDVRAKRHPVAGGGPDSAWTTLAGVDFSDSLADLIAALGTIQGIYLADRDISYAPGVGLSWRGTDHTGAGAPVIDAGDGTPETVPTLNSGPPRISFNGSTQYLADYLATVDTGLTILMVIRASAVLLPNTVYGQRDGALNVKPSLHLDAAGKLEYNEGDITVSAADRSAAWIVTAYTQAASTAAGEGYDGPTSLGVDGAADSDVNNPTVLTLGRTAPFGTITGIYLGDIFALVIAPINATDMQISDAYDALVALALDAGITVTN